MSRILSRHRTKFHARDGGNAGGRSAGYAHRVVRFEAKIGLVDLLVRTHLAESKGAARS